jgi:hypothetical protein
MLNIASKTQKNDITKMKEFDILGPRILLETIRAMNIKDAKAYAKKAWIGKVKVVQNG